MMTPVMPCCSSSAVTASSPDGEVSIFSSSHSMCVPSECEVMCQRLVPTKNRPMVLGPVWLPMTGPM